MKIPSCGKAIFSDDLAFVGGTHIASLSIVGGERQDELQKGHTPRQEWEERYELA